jgi:hypothetical protein
MCAPEGQEPSTQGLTLGKIHKGFALKVRQIRVSPSQACLKSKYFLVEPVSQSLSSLSLWDV